MNLFCGGYCSLRNGPTTVWMRKILWWQVRKALYTVKPSTMPIEWCTWGFPWMLVRRCHDPLLLQVNQIRGHCEWKEYDFCPCVMTNLTCLFFFEGGGGSTLIWYPKYRDVWGGRRCFSCLSVTWEVKQSHACKQTISIEFGAKSKKSNWKSILWCGILYWSRLGMRGHLHTGCFWCQ